MLLLDFTFFRFDLINKHNRDIKFSIIKLNMLIKFAPPPFKQKKHPNWMLLSPVNLIIRK